MSPFNHVKLCKKSERTNLDFGPLAGDQKRSRSIIALCVSYLGPLVQVPEFNIIGTVEKAAKSFGAVLIKNCDNDVGAAGRLLTPSKRHSVGSRKASETADAEDAAHVHDAWDNCPFISKSIIVEIWFVASG